MPRGYNYKRDVGKMIEQITRAISLISLSLLRQSDILFLY